MNLCSFAPQGTVDVVEEPLKQTTTDGLGPEVDRTGPVSGSLGVRGHRCRRGTVGH